MGSTGSTGSRGTRRSGRRHGGAVARALAVAGLLVSVLAGTQATPDAHAADTHTTVTRDTAPPTAAPEVVPLQVTGPAEKRFNLVLLGDGYTAEELDDFRADADAHLNVLWSIEPFASYRSYLNVYAVLTPSPESGVDCDPDLTSPRRDTPLGMGFWGGCREAGPQRLLTMDSAAAARYADLVPGTTDANRQIVGLAHSDTYGGAGGTYATASGGNALSSLITPHEIGHSLGGLQDEYDYYQRGEPGGAYEGGEPDSAHHTLLTEAQMRERHAKWWRWLGEKSLSGGTIGRHKGGMYSTKGVWRPSRHSMMKTLGYAFDQPQREVMTRAVSAKTSLVQSSTPTSAPLGDDRVVWLETMHPTGGALDVTWAVDGRPVKSARGARQLDLSRLGLAPGTHSLTATVTDPTPFVRDPAIRASKALTRTVEWTVDASKDTGTGRQPTDAAREFTGHTPTESPVGADTVVYADTAHPDDRAFAVRWRLDGRALPTPPPTRGNDRDLDLGALRLSPGSHTLTAEVTDPHAPRTKGERLTWTVDAAGPKTVYELSEPLRRTERPGRPVEYVYDGPFTMRLTGRDDGEGHVVSQFRVDGDGWYHYFGWPTDPDAPFRFTPGGTEIDGLVYGKLGTPRAVPWDDASPDYGTHTVEYRSIDAAGNASAPKKFLVTLVPPRDGNRNR
ncbi:M64 family metallopeptidase [Streptomyces sp. NPDC054796]